MAGPWPWRRPRWRSVAPARAEASSTPVVITAAHFPLEMQPASFQILCGCVSTGNERGRLEHGWASPVESSGPFPDNTLPQLV